MHLGHTEGRALVGSSLPLRRIRSERSTSRRTSGPSWPPNSQPQLPSHMAQQRVRICPATSAPHRDRNDGAGVSLSWVPHVPSCSMLGATVRRRLLPCEPVSSPSGPSSPGSTSRCPRLASSMCWTVPPRPHARDTAVETHCAGRDCRPLRLSPAAALKVVAAASVGEQQREEYVSCRRVAGDTSSASSSPCNVAFSLSGMYERTPPCSRRRRRAGNPTQPVPGRSPRVRQHSLASVPSDLR